MDGTGEPDQVAEVRMKLMASMVMAASGASAEEMGDIFGQKKTAPPPINEKESSDPDWEAETIKLFREHAEIAEEVLWIRGHPTCPINDTTAKLVQQVVRRKACKAEVVVWPASSVVTFKRDPAAIEEKMYVFLQDAAPVAHGSVIAAVDEADGVVFVIKAAVVKRSEPPLIFSSLDKRSKRGVDEPMGQVFDHFIPGPHMHKLIHHDVKSLGPGARVTGLPNVEYWLAFISASHHSGGVWGHELLGGTGPTACKIKRGKLYNWSDNSLTWQPVARLGILNASRHATSRIGAAALGRSEDDFEPPVPEPSARPDRTKLGREMKMNMPAFLGALFTPASSDNDALGLMQAFCPTDAQIDVENMTEMQRMVLCMAVGQTVTLAGSRKKLKESECATCGARRSAKLKLHCCSGCFGRISYCSIEHQTEHWPTHKEHCKETKKLVKAALKTMRGAHMFPRCRAMSKQFVEPDCAKEPINVEDALLSRTPADWIDGLTLQQASAVMTCKPQCIVASME
jgi:hypothetical protein